MTQCYPIIDVEGQFEIRGERFFMMSSQIASASIAALLACELVASENRQSPNSVFGRPADAQLPLRQTVAERVMAWPPSRPFSREPANLMAGFDRMLFADSITWATQSGLAHLGSALFAHFAAFSHRHILADSAGKEG
jgi:hypothetical protein